MQSNTTRNVEKLNFALGAFVPAGGRVFAMCGLVCGIAAFQSSCSGPPRSTSSSEELRHESRSATLFPGERHFQSLRQLTFGGQNAEAYFNGNATEIIFQSTRDSFECDQIFRMDADGANPRLVSTGVGRTTCSFIFPNQPKILYSSSHATLKTCPPRPDHSRGYVWPLLPDFDIYVAGPNGENPTPLAPHEGYDAEAVVSPQGDGIVFTSTRSGDVDIWTMNPDGTGLAQLTNEVGYDGGAFFSLDGKRIVYRANHPSSPEALKDYKELLANDLVRPSVMDLKVMNRDGSDKRTILANGAANFAPYFHPDGKRIIFASNMDADGGRDFDLYTIRVDGTGLERITFNDTFDAFPMFSYDGRLLVFASNRDGKVEGETNVFVAEWTDEVEPGVEQRLADAAPSAADWKAMVERLADPALGGRGLGTPELEKAAELIAKRFEAVGLEPAGDGGTFMQHFKASTSKTLQSASLEVGGKAAKLDEEFQPFPFSSSASGAADAVFVGFGITSGRHQYDDYAGVDVAEKVAVAFRYEPGRNDPNSKFDGTDPTRESDLRFKAINARHHGAAALVVVNPPPDDPRAENVDTLYAFDGAPSEAGIPVLHVSWAAAERLFGDKTLRDGLDAIEREIAPASKPLGVQVKYGVEIEGVQTEVANVVGKLRGTAKGRAIVVGAHFDHLGMGGESSLAPGVEAPHVGADDNASGVAAIIELAEAMKALERATDIYFVAFTGEESGLLGSHWFVEHPPAEAGSFEAMLNFDMVGRLRDGKLNVLGVDTGKGLIDVVRRAQVGLPLDLALSGDGYGPSDQMAFYVKKIPVLHFFTGAHPDYHRPSDTPDKVNPEGAVLVTTYATRVLHELANAPHGKPYVAVRSASAGDSGGDGRRGYGPYFGSIPAFGGEGDVKGVKLSGATPGSPADRAGIKEGDVIVKFGEFDVTTLRDYAFALRQHQPGDSVKVVIVRDGKEIEVEATLQEKKGGDGKKSPHGHGEPKSPAESQPQSPH